MRETLGPSKTNLLLLCKAGKITREEGRERNRDKTHGYGDLCRLMGTGIGMGIVRGGERRGEERWGGKKRDRIKAKKKEKKKERRKDNMDILLPTCS